MLNKNLKDKNNLILSVNIRRLNANFVKLEVFVDSLKTKPSIIICTETWNLEYFQLYQLSGYKIFYNESKINQNDGVVIYIYIYIFQGYFMGSEQLNFKIAQNFFTLSIL